MKKEPNPYAAGLNGAVASELRAERAALGITNKDIAELSGIPLVSVQRYLAPTRVIDVSVLEPLARAVKRTPTEIITAAEERLARERAGDVGPVEGSMSRLRNLLGTTGRDEAAVAAALGVRASVVRGWWTEGMDRPPTNTQLEKLAKLSGQRVDVIRQAILVDMGWVPAVEPDRLSERRHGGSTTHDSPDSDSGVSDHSTGR